MDEIPPIGIDLGTTFSCVGVMQNGKIDIIPNEMGERITPSMVSFTKEGLLIGEGAKYQIIKNPENTIYNVKRLIGRKYSEIENEKYLFPFKIESNEKNQIQIIVSTDKGIKKFSPEQISAMVLKELKEYSSNFIKKEVKDAIITVPAYFNDAQRQATINAGELAGLNVLRIINEPTAAAIAYGLNKKLNKSEKILIFDLGGGTFDISLLELSEDIFEVIGTKGDTHLGGEDFDRLLVDFCIDEFYKANNLDIRSNQRALKRLKFACEKCKIDLSNSLQSTIDIDSLMNGKDFNITIDRYKFEELCSALFTKCIKILRSLFEETKQDKKSIKEIILIGGSSRIPKIIELIKEFFDGKEVNISINPEEAVAYGAAVQAAIMSDLYEINNLDLILLDVTPMSLGIEKIGKKMCKVINKYTKIPVQVSKTFYTAHDYQTSIKFPVYEGEYENTESNHFLGIFKIFDIPIKKKGEVSFEVTFDIDVNSILTVTAVEESNKLSNSITIINDRGDLTHEQIEQFKKEGEMFKKSKIHSECFSKLKNIKLKMSYLEKELENDLDKNVKIQILQNLIESINEYLNVLDSNQFDNITLFDKFLIYLKKLLDVYNILLKNKKDISKDEKEKIISGVVYLIKKVYGRNMSYLFNIISLLDKNEEIYLTIMVDLMRLFFNEGLKRYNDKEYDKSKYFLSESYSYFYFNKIKNKISKYPDLEKEYDDIKESFLFYKKRITAKQLMKNGKKYLEKGVFDSENLDIDSIYIALDNYRMALKEICKEQEKSNDPEYEVKCISQIIIIEYKILKLNQFDKINKLAKHCLNIIDSLKNKNYENKKWYKDIQNIIEEIEKRKKVNHDDKELTSKIKKEKPEIFEEIKSKFKESREVFILFILQKYPYPKYKPYENIKEKLKNDPKFLRTLCGKYHPDKNIKLKNKFEEKEIEKYVIYSTISSYLNNLYSSQNEETPQ